MISARGLAILALLAAVPRPGLALDLAAPAHITLREDEALASYAVPLGSWAAGVIPGETVEGRVTRTAWSLPLDGRTTLELLDPLRQALQGEGFRLVFECQDDGCGGFDFRYQTPVLPEPAMHVDLGDYRFVSARRDGPDGTDWVTLLVSRSQAEGHVQVVEVTPAGAAVTAPPKAPAEAAMAAPADPGSPFGATGSLVLEGLAFESGKAALTDASAPALVRLADWLKADPARRVILVGHTDSSGSLAANVTLSRQRAAAVMAVLVDRLGVPAAQLSAEGVGPLAPRADNDTDQGRAENRRVEAIPAPTP